MPTGDEVASIEAPDWVIGDASFSRDGQLVLAGCRDGAAYLWNWRTGGLVCPGFSHSKTAHAARAALSPRAHWAFTAGDRLVRAWETCTGKPVVAARPLPDMAQWMKVTPDGRYVLAAGNFDSIEVFELRDLDCAETDSLDNSSLRLLGEINAGQRVHQGGTVNLTTNEWLDRRLAFRNASPDFSAFSRTNEDSDEKTKADKPR
jgi:WD40 repeat protein